ncbi:hypothetical protein K8I61_20195 [bacterium]|nr:hypothetical protein [bacterium]
MRSSLLNVSVTVIAACALALSAGCDDDERNEIEPGANAFALTAPTVTTTTMFSTTTTRPRFTTSTGVFATTSTTTSTTAGTTTTVTLPYVDITMIAGPGEGYLDQVPSMALDVDGEPHIARAHNEGSLYHHWRDVGVWKSEKVSQVGGHYSGIAIADDITYIVHVRRDYCGKNETHDTQLISMKADTDPWQTTDLGVIQGFFGRRFQNIANVAIGPEGTPRVYHQATLWLPQCANIPGFGFSAVAYYPDALAPFPSRFDIGQTTTGHALALDSLGQPHILYDANTHSYAPRYAHQAGTQWITVSLARPLSHKYLTSAIAVDDTDAAHILLYDFTDSALIYASNASGSWTSGIVADEVVDNDTLGRRADIDVDASERPHVVFFEPHDENLRYSWRYRGTWKSAVVDSQGDVGWSPTMVARDGIGHVVYAGAGAVWYAEFPLQ